MKNSNFRIWAGIVALIVLTVSVLMIWNLRRNRSVEYIHPHRGEITEAVYGLGKVKSIHRFEVKLGVLSTVKKLYVREGQFVERGDKLIEFDSNALFRAPMSGTVTLINNYDGETALPQMPIVRLENLKERFIELSLEQEGALRIKPGQQARVSFESLRGKILEGRVTALFSREDEFLADIDVTGLDDGVLPGMTADVTIEIGTIQNALLIPAKAIQAGTVLVRRNGKRQKIKVEVDHVDGVMAEIKPGSLTEADEVAIRKKEEEP
jgi:multidrug efflux pump subunit AcrA (membrane-fusion protein)